MVDLLAKLQSHQLSKGSTALSQDHDRLSTGQQRLKAGLPQVGRSLIRLAPVQRLESAQQRMMSALSIPRKACESRFSLPKVPERESVMSAVASAVVKAMQ